MSSDNDSDPGTDLPTAQSLVRLRLLAEDAARRASDISEAGRHQALVALDGACEHALWLAARHDGIRLTVVRPASLIFSDRRASTELDAQGLVWRESDA